MIQNFLMCVLLSFVGNVIAFVDIKKTARSTKNPGTMNSAVTIQRRKDNSMPYLLEHHYYCNAILCPKCRSYCTNNKFSCTKHVDVWHWEDCEYFEQ